MSIHKWPFCPITASGGTSRQRRGSNPRSKSGIFDLIWNKISSLWTKTNCGPQSGTSLAISVFLAASLADLITYVVTSIQLGLAFPAVEGGIFASIFKFMGIFAFTQIPLALSEGMLTVIVFNLLLTYNKNDIKELEVFGGNL